MGAREFQRSSQNLIAVALDILDGKDSRTIARFADHMDALNEEGEQRELDYEKAVEKRQAEWLASHHLQ